MDEKELTSRTIPGITWKQVVAYSIAVGLFVSMYIDLRNTVRESVKLGISNGQLFNEIKTEIKDDRKLDEARMQSIELQIKECRIRLDLMDKYIEGYNSRK